MEDFVKFAAFGAAAASVIAFRRYLLQYSVEDSTGNGTASLVIYELEDLKDYMVKVFTSFGVPESDADVAADVLCAADVRGIDSHGIARLHMYAELLKEGMINPTPDVRVIRETPSTATVDGDNGLGLVVANHANRIAIDKATTAGSGSVAVCNTNHFGIASYYPLATAERGMIGLSMTNTTKLVAPTFGAERMLGTNPVAVAIPAREEPPFVLDMATSAVAYGKVEICDRINTPMPTGWCIDSDGNDTDSPARMKHGGSLLPLGSDRTRGSHKGYGLSAWVDIMSAVLSGANWGPFAPPFTLKGYVGGAVSDRRVGRGIGHFFCAWRVDGFQDQESFGHQMDDWIRTLRATKRANPEQPVLIPGDPERFAMEERSHSGIPITAAVVQDLEEVSRWTGVPLPRPRQ